MNTIKRHIEYDSTQESLDVKLNRKASDLFYSEKFLSKKKCDELKAKCIENGFSFEEFRPIKLKGRETTSEFDFYGVEHIKKIPYITSVAAMYFNDLDEYAKINSDNLKILIEIMESI